MAKVDSIRDTTRYLIDLFNSIEGLKYWIDFGTLLGAIRDKDIIAWDKDADFSICRDHSPLIYPHIGDILKNTEIKVAHCHRDGALKLLPGPNKQKSSWHIDIYPWEYSPNDNKMKHPQQCFAARPTWPAEYVETLKEIDFLGTKVKVPGMVEARLKNLYGNYNKINKKTPYWG